MHRKSPKRWMRSPATWLAFAGIALVWPFIVQYWERGLIWDGAFYVSLARSLADGEGYQYMGRPHAKYPPGFPAMLAVIELLGGGFRAMHAFVAATAVLGVVLSYALLRELHGRAHAACAAAMTLGCYAFVRQCGLILSDLPYFALSMGALWSAVRMQRDGRLRWFVLTLSLAVVAYLTRSIGIVIGPAVALAAWVGGPGAASHAARDQPPDRRTIRRRGAAVAVVVLALGGAWTGYGRAIGSEISEDVPGLAPYVRQLFRADFRDPSAGDLTVALVAERIATNARRYRHHVARLFAGKRKLSVATRLVAPLCLLGWAIALVRRRSVVEFYAAGYLAILLLWPAKSERFLVPVLPLIFHYALCAVLPWTVRGRESSTDPPSGRLALFHRSPAPRSKWLGRVGGSVLAVALGSTLFANARLDYAELRAQSRTPYYQPLVIEYRLALAWVERNTEPEAPIVTDQAPMAFALTGRVAYPFSRSSDPNEVLASIERWGRPIVVANEFRNSRLHLNPAIARHRDRFRELHRIGSQVIYRFEPDANPDQWEGHNR